MSHLTHHTPEVPVFYCGCRYCPWQGAQACQALNKARNCLGNDPELACHFCGFEEGTCMLSFLNISCVFSSLTAKENIFYSSFNEDYFVPSAKQSQNFNESNGLGNNHNSHEPWGCAHGVQGDTGQGEHPLWPVPK